MVGREETYSAFVKTRGDKCLHVDPNVIAVSCLRDFLPHPTSKKKLEHSQSTAHGFKCHSDTGIVLRLVGLAKLILPQTRRIIKPLHVDASDLPKKQQENMQICPPFLRVGLTRNVGIIFFSKLPFGFVFNRTENGVHTAKNPHSPLGRGAEPTAPSSPYHRRTDFSNSVRETHTKKFVQELPIEPGQLA